MKYNVIVGIPPYQISDGGAQASATPIYYHFVDIAKAMGPEWATMIMPTRWYAGGKGLDEFRDEMLHDTTIQELHDYLHAEELFPGTNNRGGICYLLWNKCYDNTKDLVKVTTHEGNGNINVANRNLIYKDLDIFVRNSKAIDILNKVVDSGEVALSTYISAAKAFGFRTFFISDPLFRPDPSGLNTPVKCYGRSGRIGYVEKAEIPSHTEWIDRWKVYVPESNNIGTELNDDNQNAFVGEPNSICTETFLVVGAALGLSEESAANLVGYLKTKFARFLLSLAKISQHGTTRTYRFVPAQDFETLWTDAKLYQKYALSVDEIAVIESSIKPME